MIISQFLTCFVYLGCAPTRGEEIQSLMKCESYYSTIQHSSMFQSDNRDLEMENVTGMLLAHSLVLVPTTLPACVIDSHLQQPSQEESRVGDSPGPLFTMYSEMAEKEDNKSIV
jgi:hypothetical protein